MAMQIGNGVRLHGFPFEDSIFTFYAADDIITLEETAGSTAVGRAVEIDFGTKAGQVKLATDGAHVFGRIEAVENRKQENIQVVAVALNFLQRLQKSNAPIAVGSSVVGAGEGLVKQAGSTDLTNNVVPEAAAGTDSLVTVIKA